MDMAPYRQVGWGLVATWRSVSVHQMNRVNFCNFCGHDDSTINIVTVVVIMVALWNRADHYIFMLWFLLLFPRLISAVTDWMSAILPYMVSP